MGIRSGLTKAIRAVFPELEAGRLARRLANWTPSKAHVNTLIASSGKTVVARSRYLTRNNAYAMAAVECFAANLVGCGIHPTWVLDDDKLKESVHEAWRLWGDECDSEGVTNFGGLQRRVARELFIAGECFIRRRPRYLSDDLSAPMQLELLPSEQLPTERNMFLENGNRVRQGIEFDQIGRRVAYHFWKVHPGDLTQSYNFGKITIVPASDVLHIHDPIESGQIRGLPRMTPAIVALWMLDAYDDAELERKKTAALFSVFIKRQDASTTFLDKLAETQAATTGGDATIDLQPGVAHQLLPGEEVQTAMPADVGPGYEVFQYRNLSRFCAAVGLPYSAVTGDMIKANYGNQRAAMLEMRRRMEALQESVIIYQMCRPISVWWMEAALLSGNLKIPGYVRDPDQYQNINWITPRWDWIDPLKDRQAEAIAVDAGFKSRSQVIREEGNDPMEVDREIAEEQERAEEMGITLNGILPLNKMLQEAPPGGQPASNPDDPTEPAAPLPKKPADPRRTPKGPKALRKRRTVVTKCGPDGRIAEFETHLTYEDDEHAQS